MKCLTITVPKMLSLSWQGLIDPISRNCGDFLYSVAIMISWWIASAMEMTLASLFSWVSCCWFAIPWTYFNCALIIYNHFVKQVPIHMLVGQVFYYVQVGIRLTIVLTESERFTLNGNGPTEKIYKCTR